MGVFKRTASTSSERAGTSGSSSSATKPTPSRSGSTPSIKGPKPSKPSLVQRVSSSVKPTPKPKPSLLRRATTGLSEVSTTRWEKRMLKRVERFPKDHPLLVKLFGAGLCLAGAGAGAIGIPAVAAALGIKLAVVGGTATITALSGVTATAGFGAAAQGAAVAGLVAGGAKVLLSSLAIDVGSRMVRATETPRPQGLFGFGRKRNNTTKSEGGLMSLVPIMSKAIVDKQ